MTAALLLAVAVLAFLLYPVERGVDGAGILRPRYEQNALIRVPVGNTMVTRLDVQYLQPVEVGAPLFTYLGRGRRMVATVAALPPGQPQVAASEPDPFVEQRIAQQRASNAWYAQALAASGPAWELRLCTDWGHRLGARNDIERYEAGIAKGGLVPVAEGQPFPSPFTGTVVALWIAPGMTVGSLFPVLELMVDETPLEVLGLVPAGERAALKSAEPQGSVRRHETPIASQIKAVTGVEVGGATLQPSDIALLFPGVPVTGPSAVVRVQLAAKAAPEDVGRVVRFRLGAGRRPRLWTWLSSR